MHKREYKIISEYCGFKVIDARYTLIINVIGDRRNYLETMKYHVIQCYTMSFVIKRVDAIKKLIVK